MRSPTTVSPIDQIQGRLLVLAGLFLGLFALGLGLSPSANTPNWQLDIRWDHWPAFILWVVLALWANRETARWLPDRDPYLLPVAALLSGWGLLTIWRLAPQFGLRQSIWLLVATGLLAAGLRLSPDLGFLRRYKYLWLSGGLLITAATLIFGTNPSGAGLPRLWLGCCGIYFQPSEPLKLLLIVYLAAYLADRLPLSVSLWPLLAPTLLMAGVGLLLLLAQRDLGTASILLFLYTITIYVASARKQILLVGAGTLGLSGLAGYQLFSVVRLRMDAWLNPWLDPSGGSYQVIQSLMAIANGELIGRGPGMGYPWLVPVNHSDFIFSAVAEETGLFGGIGLLLAIALLTARGLRIALCAPGNYRRYLAAGLTTYISAQSILIIGGNLRLLPLTGVTLPFVSYGGSSLVTSFVSLLLLLHISNQPEQKPAPIAQPHPYLQLGGLLILGLAAAAILHGWWVAVRGPDLLLRTDNPRRGILDRYVQRGSLLDRHNTPLVQSTGPVGDYSRKSLYPLLGAVLGYNHPIYGQTGIEASLDSYLRGRLGNPGLFVWWSDLLYGRPPPGLDVRLSLDLDLQLIADQALQEQTGALVLLNARNGEILVMSSHPTFDPNQLDEKWLELIQDERAPLINRATQGQYQPGMALGPFLLAAANGLEELPETPNRLMYSIDGKTITCAATPKDRAWGSLVAAGCPEPLIVLGQALQEQSNDLGEPLNSLFQSLGLFTPPAIHLPVAPSESPPRIADANRSSIGQAEVLASPLQLSLAAAALSNSGVMPAPSLVLGVNTPASGWVVVPPLARASQALPVSQSESAARALAAGGLPYWQTLARAINTEDQTITWYLGGTLPGWQGTPLAVSLVLERDDPGLAEAIGQSLLQAAMQP